MHELAPIFGYGGTGFTVYGTAVAEAYLALARGDSTEALRHFLGALRYPQEGRVEPRTVLPESVCPVYFCPAERLQLARLLVASGRDLDAAAVLDWSHRMVEPMLRPLFAFERARVHERLGNDDVAVDAYSFVVSSWRNPDPALQPVTDQARAALARLVRERRFR